MQYSFQAFQSGIGARGVSGASYTTNFPLTENPISEGGVWVRGLADGLDWTDPQTASGLCFGTQVVHGAPPFDDSIAHLQGFAANHSASGVVHFSGASGSLEIELLLRATITAHSAKLYEVDILSGGNFDLVRWNGPLNSFTVLVSGVSAPSPTNGDVWFAQMVGNIITVKLNGATLLTSDRTGDGTIHTTGNPGVGFYDLGAASANSTFSWDSFTASDV